MHAAASHARASATPTRHWLVDGLAHDWALALGALWLVAGLHLDGWAHAHRPGLETFFTPWHAVLYSGYFVAAGIAVLVVRARRAEGMDLAEHRLTLVGAAAFMVGGVGDMVWHETLGIEVGVEALLSPTHLVLAVSMGILATAPLRSAWRRSDARSFADLVPAMLSAGLLLGVLTFFTQFLQPGGRAWSMSGNHPTTAVFPTVAVTPDFPVFPGGVPSTDIALLMGIGGMLVATTLFVVVALVLATRWRLPFGSLTLAFLVQGILMGVMRDTGWHWLPAVLAAGLAGDAVLASIRGPRRLVVLGATIPAALWSAALAAQALQGGVWWSVHAWAGSICAMAIVGALLALAFETRRTFAAA